MRDKIKKEQLNNKGFSLIELIVIMIIVVILATAVVVAFVNSDTQKTKTSASLVSKYLDNVLNYSLTKGDAYFAIIFRLTKITILSNSHLTEPMDHLHLRNPAITSRKYI